MNEVCLGLAERMTFRHDHLFDCISHDILVRGKPVVLLILTHELEKFRLIGVV